MRAIAIVIIILGVTVVAWGGFSYAQNPQTETSVVSISGEKVVISPVVGFGALIVGGILLGASVRRRGKISI